MQCELLKAPKLKLFIPKSLDQALPRALEADASKAGSSSEKEEHYSTESFQTPALEADASNLAGSSSEKEDHSSSESYQPSSPHSSDTDSETKLVYYRFTFVRHFCRVVDMQ